MDIVTMQLEFDGIDQFYSNNYIEKYEMFNYYLDNNPNFNPNGQYHCYYKMWAIQIVLNEYLTDNLSININQDDWNNRIKLQYDLVLRLVNEFNSEIDLYGMYMSAYNFNLFAEKNNIPYNFYIMNFINEKEKNLNKLKNENIDINDMDDSFKNKRKKLIN
jgi:hypothetical protein